MKKNREALFCWKAPWRKVGLGGGGAEIIRYVGRTAALKERIKRLDRGGRSIFRSACDSASASAVR